MMVLWWASISGCVHQSYESAFPPGEELDDGVAQELQPLVVIDPRGGGETVREDSEEDNTRKTSVSRYSDQRSENNSSSHSITSSHCLSNELISFPPRFPFLSQLKLIFLSAGLPGVLITRIAPLIAPVVSDSTDRYVLATAYLEGEGSSWPRRDIMLINVLIPGKIPRAER